MDDAAQKSITIGSKIVDQVLAAAAASPDREVCGLLLGMADEIVEARPAANVAADPRRAFEIDPRALIAAHRAARAGGPSVAGCYHSHPSGDPAPSSADRDAAEPGAVWLIAGRGEVRAWRATEAGFLDIGLAPIQDVVRPDPAG